MALTDFAALDAAQRKAWSVDVFKAGREQSLIMGQPGFMGKGVQDATKAVHYVNDLTRTARGDKCIMHIVLDLENDGVFGKDVLDGREEALEADTIEIAIDKMRHGTRRDGEISEQKTVIRFREQAKDTLSYWMANKVDEMFFLTAAGRAWTTRLDGSTRSGPGQELSKHASATYVTAPTSGRQVFPGTVTATSGLAASDKMSWAVLLKAKTHAIEKKIKPIMVAGKPCYIVLVSPRQARDLKQDATYLAAVQQAGPRNIKSNPLFTGAIAMVDGLIIYEHHKVPTTLGLASGSKWGSGGLIEGAQAILMGSQAVGFARVGTPAWKEDNSKDYEDKPGIAYEMMLGFVKTVFKSRSDSNTDQDFSIISIYTAAA